MMDLFEEFSGNDVTQVNNFEPVSDAEAPIFSLSRKEVILSRNTPSRRRQIVKAACNNSIIIFATSDCSILRWTIDGEAEEIEVSKRSEDSINNVFIDYNGNHVIISLKNGDNYYLHCKSSRPKKLSRLQGRIESVAFDRQQNIAPTSMSSNANELMLKSFLVGTNLGMIYEILVDSVSGKEKICQIVHQLEQQIPITSLYFDYISNTGNMSSNMEESDSASSGRQVGDTSCSRIFIICSTTAPTRLYHFIGTSVSFQQLFNDHSQSGSSSFIELPGSVPSTELGYVCMTRTINGEPLKSYYFAMLTEFGVYNGFIYFSNINAGGASTDASAAENCTIEGKMSSYSELEVPTNAGGSASIPVSLLLSDFHVLLLSPDNMEVVAKSKLDGSLVQSLPLENNQVSVGIPGLNTNASLRPIGLVKDSNRNCYYVYGDSATSVYQINMQNEDRDIWRIYMQLGVKESNDSMFHVASKHCKTKEDSDILTATQAEFYLQNGQLVKAASYFAKTSSHAFDEIVLVLLGLVPYVASTSFVTSEYKTEYNHTGMVNHALSQLNLIDHTAAPDSSGVVEFHAARTYLEETLKGLPSSSKSQKTMIATWLCEIYLYLIHCASILPPTKIARGASPPPVDMSKPITLQSLPSVAQVTSLFKDFLRANRNLLDQSTTISLLASRNHRTLLLFFAQIIGDYDKVVGHFVTENKFSDVIQLLNDAPLERIEHLIYKTAPILVEFAPEITMNLLLNKTPILQFKCIMPCILRYTELLDKLLKKQSDIKASSPMRGGYGDDDGGFSIGSNINTDFEGHTVNFAVVFVESFIGRMESEGCLNESSLVYHTYIWLLMKYDSVGEERLMNLIRPWVENAAASAAATGSSSGSVYAEYAALLHQHNGIELSYVIRLCKRYNRRRSMVYVYVLLNMPQRSVKIAMDVDLRLAKEIAGLPMSALVQKKLWMLIAFHVMNSSGADGSANSNALAVKNTLSLIAASNGVLTIGDLLPHLPDITDISILKDDICSILEDNGEKIERIKAEISDLSTSADNIVKELEVMKSKGSNLSLHQCCEYCSTVALFNKPFYLFPCGHGYHIDCMVKLYVGDQNVYSNGVKAVSNCQSSMSNAIRHHILTPAQVANIKSINEQISVLTIRGNAASSQEKRVAQQVDILQTELDGLIASDCPLCGDVMINLIGVPLLSNDSPRDVAEAKSWEL